MGRSLRTFLLMFLSAFLLFGCVKAIKKEGKSDPRRPFTIVVLPDTQYYHFGFSNIFMNQTEWIRDNQEKMNIVAVIHLGDITDENSEEEWEESYKALSVLDGIVPLFLVPGNHDTGPNGTRWTIETKLLDKYFPPSRFRMEPWFGGVFEKNSIKNAYYFLDAGEIEFIIVCLEFGPRDVALEWAGKVLSKHKDKTAIIVSHCYMYHDDTRVGEGDEGNPHKYMNGGNDGEEMWNELVRKHKKVAFVLSGHIAGDGTGRQTSEGDNGNKVHELLSNYQMVGDGWLRIMQFVPDKDKVYVSTYSPYVDKFREDPENKFALDYRMKR